MDVWDEIEQERSYGKDFSGGITGVTITSDNWPVFCAVLTWMEFIGRCNDYLEYDMLDADPDYPSCGGCERC